MAEEAEENRRQDGQEERQEGWADSPCVMRRMIAVREKDNLQEYERLCLTEGCLFDRRAVRRQAR